MDHPELIFTQNISRTLADWRSGYAAEGVLLCDSNTRKFCLPLLTDCDLPLIELPAGEAYKNLQSAGRIIDELISLKAGKNTVLFCLGGGVITDMGGFAASVYRRGIRFVHIPTTLLAMVDAAIGGKTAVDHRHLKNYIGTFALPEAILISEEFLSTLPSDELRSARAEIVKTAVIASAALFELLLNDAPLHPVIRLCATTKQALTEQDFKDKGVRQLLNFGHSIGHAYESSVLASGQSVPHGYAVARGMLFETGLALHLGLIRPGEAERIRALCIAQTGVTDISDSEFEALFPYLAADKKNTDQRITFSLPLGIGSGRHGIRLLPEELLNWKKQGYI